METTANTKKLTKAERLAVEIVRAKAELEAAQARLQPQIAAAEQEIAELERAHKAADKAQTNAYSAVRTARGNAQDKLQLQSRMGELLNQLHAFTEARGLKNADLHRLANKYIDRIVSADPQVTAAEKEYSRLRRLAEESYGKLNRSQTPGGTRARLRHELEQFQERLEKLERELAALPHRRETERARRAEERREEQESHDTDEALKVLGEFTWEREQS